MIPQRATEPNMARLESMTERERTEAIKLMNLKTVLELTRDKYPNTYATAWWMDLEQRFPGQINYT